MAFIGQEPNFYCSQVNNTELNKTEFAGRSVEDGICSKKNRTQCPRFQFEDEMRTVVSEVVHICSIYFTVFILYPFHSGY